ncbi:MAG: response regulator, partial [Epsilonproteobacteria bacterium]|nr:response regulator [Campylobacterota bacterium]
MIKKVLVIEDSKIINNIIKKELSKQNLKVEQAFTLKEAIEALSKHTFHLIILDLHLPDGEGSELIANIQSLTKTKVVVLTSFEHDELREELFNYGILDYIIKDKNLL